MIWQVVVQIEPGKVTFLLLLNFFDYEFRKQHSTFRMIRKRQRKEAFWPQPGLTDFRWLHSRKLFPGDAVGQFHPHATLNWLSLCHLRTGGRLVRQLVA